MPSRTLGPEGKWIVRFHIGWREERNIFHIRVWKPLPSKRVLETFKESPKKISTSGRLGLLQMVLELDLGLCVSEDTRP